MPGWTNIPDIPAGWSHFKSTRYQNNMLVWKKSVSDLGRLGSDDGFLTNQDPEPYLFEANSTVSGTTVSLRPVVYSRKKLPAFGSHVIFPKTTIRKIF